MSFVSIDLEYLSSCNRIIVIGCQGSGKSYFSSELSKKIGFRCIHLDDYYWGHNWKAISQHDWDYIYNKLILKKRIVIDGLYLNTLENRIENVDLVFFLDLPLRVCSFSVLKRTIINIFTGRYLPLKMKNDFKHGWVKPIYSIKFMFKLINNYKKYGRNRINDILNKSDTPVYVIKRRRDVNRFLNEL